ncbi:MAG: PA14 domain-containing protein [Anaerolineae bacterium]
MDEQRHLWRNAAVILTSVALLTIGIGVIIYVGLARDRIMPTPTPQATANLTPSDLTGTPDPRVVGTVREYAPGALIIIITPREGTVEQVILTEEAIISFANGLKAAPKDIVPGVTILAEGPLDALGRMIARRITIEEGSASGTPTATRTGAATPTLNATLTPTVNAWRGEYFDNPDLSGDPVLVRTDKSVDFQWQGGSPSSEVPVDGFSVRWTGQWDFIGGGYRFNALTDDGVRVWVDGALLIDQWRRQGATLAYADQVLEAGAHEVRVEYFDDGEAAQARVWWESQGSYPAWKGEYYANRDLTGSPALVRNDADISFDWGKNAPAAQMPADNFSVRWSRSLDLSEGNYRFWASVDDGVRLWVDDLLLIDRWQAGPVDDAGYIWLDRGPHDVRVEYMEGSGNATARVGWETITSFPDWKGEYYANPDLVGRPAFLRNDRTVDMNWETGSPGSGLPADNFSVRWSRDVQFDAGAYRFWVIADDAVRVYVDGSRIINAWRDGGGEAFEAVGNLSAGSHRIVIEYYERGGQAMIRAGWERAATPTVQPSATASPTPTATLPAPTWTPVTPPAAPPTATPTWTPTPESEPEGEAI